MWTRAELKQRGKAAFHRNYWKCVLVSLVLMLFVSGGGGSSSNSDDSIDQDSSYLTSDEALGILDGMDYSSEDLEILFEDGTEELYEEEDAMANYVSIADDMLLNGFPVSAAFKSLGVAVWLILFAIVLLLQIFVLNLFEIGGCSYYIHNASEPADLGHLISAFKGGHYGKMVITLFIRKLCIVLWGLLLIVPGIVKTYEYRMIPYLMADEPEMSREDAFRISKEMMTGEKWNAFVLDLSFVLWSILSSVTLGIAGVFYVNPYVDATNAELYLELKRQYFDEHRW